VVPHEFDPLRQATRRHRRRHRREPRDAPRFRVSPRDHARPSRASRRGCGRQSHPRNGGMSIALYRIDDRLIHGQVVVGWGQPLDCTFIVLVDDMVAASEGEQELYRMGVPPEMEVYFHSAADAIAELPRYRADKRQGILLTGDIATMKRL